MAKEARCEGRRPVEGRPKPGKNLLPGWGQCTNLATYLVERPFSGIATNLCKTHAGRYHKMARLGLATVTELKEQ